MTKATVRVLKNRHKQLCDMPGLELDPETLCLRNAYFKLNYMKRKLRKMAMPPSPSIAPLVLFSLPQVLIQRIWIFPSLGF